MLSSLPKLFKDVTHPPEQVERPAAAAAVDADGVADGAADSPTPEVAWEGADALARLLAFCALDFKSAMMADVLCPGALDLASSQPAAAGDDTNPRTAKVLDSASMASARAAASKGSGRRGCERSWSSTAGATMASWSMTCGQTHLSNSSRS